MAKCKFCGKWKPFMRTDAMGYCAECSAARIKLLEKEARERRIESEKQHRNQEIHDRNHHQEEQAVYLAEQRKQLEQSARSFVPPAVMNGFCLSYSYTKVEFYCPDECREYAASVPAYKQLTLCREPDNEYDSEAIAISYEGHKLGYMYKGKLRDMLNDYANDDEKEFLVVSRYWSDKPTYDLFFYKSAHAIISQIERMPDHKIYTLIHNRDEDTQFSLSLNEVGEPVSIEYDSEKERYAAICDSCYIGCFPKSADEYLEEHIDFEARIASNDRNDSDIYVVKVALAPKHLSDN